MKFDTLTRAVLLALCLAVGPEPARAVDKGDLIEAWRKRDRATRDYGRALRKLKKPTAEDKARLKQEILIPADAEFNKTRGDYQKEAVERINQKAAAADKAIDRELEREPATKAGAKAGDKAGTKAGDKAGTKAGPAKEKQAAAKADEKKGREPAAAKAAVERPGVPAMWERAPRRDVQLDGEGIPEEMIFEKGRGKAAEPVPEAE